MEGTSLGPFCTEIQLSEEHLNELTSIKSLENCHVKIGVLLELNTFLKSAAKVIDKAQKKTLNVQCFGLLYIKVTGPYWNLVTMGEVPYLLLYTHIQDLASFLKQCSSTPETLLNPEGHWKSDDTSDLYAVPHHKRLAQKLFVVAQSTVGILHQTIKTVTSAMLRTVENQLVDFLPGGKYSKAPSKADLERTSFSHSTNLGCEHHFGDLDSSQKRRPNASMHHHTTVQLLKRNRKSLIHWLSDMPSNKKEEMMKKARKGGRVLREQNMNAEKEVEMEINRNMIEEKENPRKCRKTNGLSEIGNEPEEDYDCITNKLPVINEFSDNEYIAVAYQDQWYPGGVVKSSGPEAIVNSWLPVGDRDTLFGLHEKTFSL